MPDNHLVSIIVPIFNVENYLRACLDSISHQTYRNLDIILVDDGSTDASGTICDEYAPQDGRIRVIHQENGGLSAARNTGFRAAKGDFVYFLDSDDWILPETIKELLACACNEQADLVFFEAESFSDIKERPNPKQTYLRNHRYPTAKGIDVFKQLIRNKEYHYSVPLLFLNRSLLSENALIFMEGIIYEDLIFTYEAYCLSKRTAHLFGAYYMRRYRPDSLTTSAINEKNYRSLRIAYNTVRDFAIAARIDRDNHVREYISRCASNAINCYKRLGKSQRAASRQDYRTFIADIKTHGAFGDPALLMKCYGTAYWIIYKIFDKALRHASFRNRA